MDILEIRFNVGGVTIRLFIFQFVSSPASSKLSAAHQFSVQVLVKAYG